MEQREDERLGKKRERANPWSARRLSRLANNHVYHIYLFSIQLSVKSLVGKYTDKKAQNHRARLFLFPGRLPKEGGGG